MTQNRSAKKKVLIVTDAWHPQVNGVVTVFEKMKEYLEAKGFQVVLIHPGLFECVPLPIYPEIQIAIFPRFKMAKMIRDESPDYIHIATEGTLGLAARRYCVHNKLRFTSSYHTHFPMYIKARVGIFLQLTYAYLRWFHNRSTTTMTGTESVCTALEAQGFKHVVLWPLGVDAELFIKNPHPQVPVFPKPVFVYFGRIAIEKSVEKFLKLTLPGTKIIIGDGPDRKWLEERYGRSHTFVGYKHGQELVDWISIADVFVFPSKTDTFGLTIIEALACSVPVAAYEAPGPKDIVRNGIDGILGDDLQASALAALELSREPLRERALQFSWEHSSQIFMQHLVPSNAEHAAK